MCHHCATDVCRDTRTFRERLLTVPVVGKPSNQLPLIQYTLVLPYSYRPNPALPGRGCGTSPLRPWGTDTQLRCRLRPPFRGPATRTLDVQGTRSVPIEDGQRPTTLSTKALGPVYVWSRSPTPPDGSQSSLRRHPGGTSGEGSGRGLEGTWDTGRPLRTSRVPPTRWGKRTVGPPASPSPGPVGTYTHQAL